VLWLIRQFLLKEIKELNEKGISTDRLLISDRAHVIMPYHKLLDELQEKFRGENSIGTTKRGIGRATLTRRNDRESECATC